ncbi:hypothetical protein PHSC3_002073 [Chlamydiales bacterium STE3]|nr:hypothetical protein PHSC3_002073 [Chlamydiales bacterium STE3]
MIPQELNWLLPIKFYPEAVLKLKNRSKFKEAFCTQKSLELISIKSAQLAVLIIEQFLKYFFTSTVERKIPAFPYLLRSKNAGTATRMTFIIQK